MRNLKNIYIYFFAFYLLNIFLWASSFNSEEDILSISQFSNYSENTIKNANDAFIKINEGEDIDALKPLKYAALKGERSSLMPYAFYLLSEKNLMTSPNPWLEIRWSASLILKAYYRQVDEATAFYELIVQDTDLICGKKRNGDINLNNKMTQNTLDELINTFSKEDLQIWLKECSSTLPNFESQHTQKRFQDMIDLFSLALVNRINDNILIKIRDKILITYLNKFSNKKMTKLNPAYIDIFANEFLKVKTSFSSPYKNPTHPYSYYNPKHKILYILDMGMKHLNSIKKAGLFQIDEEVNIDILSKQNKLELENKNNVVNSNKKTKLNIEKTIKSNLVLSKCAPLFSTGKKDKGFVNGTPELKAAGPMYIGLKKDNYNSSKATIDKKNTPYKDLCSLNQQFFINPVYRLMSHIFLPQSNSNDYGNNANRSLWLVELTHMDKPWVQGKEYLDKEYGEDNWPNPTKYQTKPERDKEGEKITDLKKEYNKLISIFVNSEDIQKSILYRLFALSIMGEINESQSTTSKESSLNPIE